jgi:hypothetical protein
MKGRTLLQLRKAARASLSFNGLLSFLEKRVEKGEMGFQAKGKGLPFSVDCSLSVVSC